MTFVTRRMQTICCKLYLILSSSDTHNIVQVIRANSFEVLSSFDWLVIVRYGGG